jgi:hypothetical protein
MKFTFAEIINALNTESKRQNYAFDVALGLNPPSDYKFITEVLPMQNKPDFHIAGGSMRLFVGMAAPVPMDSTPPKLGQMEASTFSEETAKFGGRIDMIEKDQRELMSNMANLSLTGASDSEVRGLLSNKALAFASMFPRAHWSTMEYLATRAIQDGALAIQVNGAPVNVNYGFPSGTIFTERTGTSAYNGSASVFWNDIKLVYDRLSNPRFIMNSNTWRAIASQAFNSLDVVGDSFGMTRTFQKFRGSLERQSSDPRERMTAQIYDGSGALINYDNVGGVTNHQYIDDGKIICIGEPKPDGFTLDLSGTDDPTNEWALGYTHIAPTVEGLGRSGLWSKVYVPEDRPMQLRGLTFGNYLPVIINPKRLVILRTTIS